MEQLIKNQSSLDKNWLMEISPALKDLPREAKITDEKGKEIMIGYSNQINIIIFDWLCRDFFRGLKLQAIDAQLLSELWGGDGKGSYRIQDKLYFVYGKIRCFQEESLNIAKDKSDHRWFVHKVQFSEERFKEAFTSGSLNLAFVKKMIREETFEEKYPDYLHKPIADFFFE